MEFAVRRSQVTTSLLRACSLALCGLGVLAAGAAANASVTLQGHAASIISGSSYVGEVPSTQKVDLAIVLPLRNKAALTALVQRIYNPNDPLYGQYLTPASLREGYGPTQADYDAVKAFAVASGLTITNEHASRQILDVSGPAANVNAAFGVKLHQYKAADGRAYHSVDTDPMVPDALSGKVSAVVGLNTFAIARPHLKVRPNFAPASVMKATPKGASGHNSAYAPADYLAGYGLYSTLSNKTLTGSGQVIALIELGASYNPANISTFTSYYSNYFNIFEGSNSSYVPPVSAISVDSQPTLYSNAANDPSAEAEVELDIETSMSMAPGVSKILVYDGLNTGQGILDLFDAIATDTTNTGTGAVPNVVSMSWGMAEADLVSQGYTSYLESENTLLTGMAALGQSVFISSGDSGAYQDWTSTSYSDLSVSDPASQPYATGVGGTSLSLSGSGTTATYASEVTWNNTVAYIEEGYGGASGGGVGYWPIPSFQSTYIPASRMGSSISAGIQYDVSSTNRNVPDVSLNADPYTGYDIYCYDPNYGYSLWEPVGGTSASSPLWAGFTALLNQKRLANGLPVAGFINPALYQFAASGRYNSDFHDITSGNNVYYGAATGYDDATGWGSFNGLNLLNDLAPATTYRTFPSGLNFFSIPYDYSSATLATLFNYTSGTPDVLVWNPTTSTWVQQSNIQLGTGYWVRFPNAVTIASVAPPGTATTSISGSTYFPISLKAGWNQVGNPFTSAITLGNTIMVGVGSSTYTWGTAVSNGTVLGTLYYFNPSVSLTAYQSLTTGGSIQPGSAYWVYATKASTLYLP